MRCDPDSADIADYFESLGPWTTAEAAAAYMHITLDQLRLMVGHNEMIAVRFADRKLYLPTWQFGDGRVLDGVPQVLAVLMPALQTPETCAAWFADTVYDGGLLRRIDELRAGRGEHVLRDAVRDARRLRER